MRRISRKVLGVPKLSRRAEQGTHRAGGPWIRGKQVGVAAVSLVAGDDNLASVAAYGLHLVARFSVGQPRGSAGLRVEQVDLVALAPSFAHGNQEGPIGRFAK